MFILQKQNLIKITINKISHIILMNKSGIKKELPHWLDSVKADVVCLQEIKAMPEQFDQNYLIKIFYRYTIFK